MNRKLITVILLLPALLLFAGCSRRRSTRRTSQESAKVQPKVKPDTVYMVVPDSNNRQATLTVVSDSNGTVIIPSNKKLKLPAHGDNLPVPPAINFSHPAKIPTRSEYIDSHNITGEMEELIVACDYDNPTVRDNTVSLVSASPGSFNLGQICDIFDFCYQNWSYVNDPLSRDYFAKASETLRNGLNGDCDDFAILLCSMVLSVGGEARINFAYNRKDGHAFTEVNIGTTDRNATKRYLEARYGHPDMWHKEDADGNWWLNLDWQGAYPGAKYWDYDRGTCFNIIRNIYQPL